MKDSKLGWYLITKAFKGGGDYYAIRLTKEMSDRFDSWDDFLEYIGENTGGGHNYGYSIKARHKNKKPVKYKGREVKTLQFKPITETKLVVG